MKRILRHLLLIALFIFNYTNLFPQVSFEIKFDNSNDINKMILTINNNSNDNIILLENPFRLFIDAKESLLYPFFPKMVYQPFSLYFYNDTLSFYDIGITNYDNLFFDDLIRIKVFKKSFVIFLLPDFIDSVFIANNYMLSFITYTQERKILKKISTLDKSEKEQLIMQYNHFLKSEDTIYVSNYFIGSKYTDSLHKIYDISKNLKEIIMSVEFTLTWDNNACEHKERIRRFKEM